jgi:ABC-type phosphate transport system substrate-binding protein
MLNRRTLFAVWISGVAAFLPATSAPWANAEEAKPQLAIVVAKDSPLSDLSIHDLKNIYMGDRISAPGGKQLIPIGLRAGSPERAAFEQSVIGMASDRLSKYWIDRKIRGQSGPPKSVDTAELLQLVVTKLDGGIGYVSAGAVSNGVKIVRIDGKAPGEPGYPVKL